MLLNAGFQYSLKKFGEPDIYDKPSPKELDVWTSQVLEPLIDFWREFGWTSFLKGRLWLPNPHDFTPLMEVLFDEDPDIDHTKCHLISYTAFGDLGIWSEEVRVIRVSLPQGWCFCEGITGGPFEGNIENLATFPFIGNVKTGYDVVDENGKPLFNRAVKKYGALEPRECFGYVPALAMGGSGDLDEIQRVKALEHFIFISQLQPLTLMKWEGTSIVPVRHIGAG
jgi:hypothetical protein